MGPIGMGWPDGLGSGLAYIGKSLKMVIMLGLGYIYFMQSTKKISILTPSPY